MIALAHKWFLRFLLSVRCDRASKTVYLGRRLAFFFFSFFFTSNTWPTNLCSKRFTCFAWARAVIRMIHGLEKISLNKENPINASDAEINDFKAAVFHIDKKKDLNSSYDIIDIYPCNHVVRNVAPLFFLETLVNIITDIDCANIHTRTQECILFTRYLRFLRMYYFALLLLSRRFGPFIRFYSIR